MQCTAEKGCLQRLNVWIIILKCKTDLQQEVTDCM